MAKPKAKDDREKIIPEERSPEERIEALKRRAEELCGGQMEVIENAGVSLPPPDSLKDEELAAKLQEVIQKLALLHVFIEQTDHLSDRELYTHLWTDSLREETPALPLIANSAYHIQLLGSGSEEDTRLYLKYYADDTWRRQWQKDFPGDPIPAHEDPPYDRDRLLPRPDYGPPTGRDPN